MSWNNANTPPSRDVTWDTPEEITNPVKLEQDMKLTFHTVLAAAHARHVMEQESAAQQTSTDTPSEET